ncbi:hypothetical protein D3C80_1452970 [compost metagenome]
MSNNCRRLSSLISVHIQNILCKTLGRTGNCITVHAIAARTNNTAKTPGTKFQVTIETVLKLCRIIFQITQLLFGILINRSII